jgi:putative Holliday junction resolvase
MSEFDDAARNLPLSGALLGLDLGDKTIGVAACDAERRVATPVTTVRRTKFTEDAAELVALATERRAVGFVLGLPRNMDGTEGPRAQSTRAFARNFARTQSLPVLFWDERLSTAAMDRALIELDTSRAKRREKIDESAAAFILQGAIDRLRSLAREDRL